MKMQLSNIEQGLDLADLLFPGERAICPDVIAAKLSNRYEKEPCVVMTHHEGNLQQRMDMCIVTKLSNDDDVPTTWFQRANRLFRDVNPGNGWVFSKGLGSLGNFDLGLCSNIKKYYKPGVSRFRVIVINRVNGAVFLGVYIEKKVPRDG